MTEAKMHTTGWGSRKEILGGKDEVNGIMEKFSNIVQLDLFGRKVTYV